MISEYKQNLILKHFKNKEEVFWYGSSWNTFSNLDDLSILMFYFYYFENCKKNNYKKILYNYFYKNYHSNKLKSIQESFYSNNYFHLENYVRLLREHEYLSEDITELFTCLENLKIETNIQETKVNCEKCCGTGDQELDDIWEDCRYCEGKGYELEDLQQLTEQSNMALEELSCIISPLLINVKNILCIKVLDENLLKVREKIFPEYKVLKSVKNF